METASEEPLLSSQVQCAPAGCGFADPRVRESDSLSRSKAVRKLLTATILCGIFIAVEIAGGLLSHSLAILTDASHLLSDLASFAISLFAIWASSWEATPRQTYGFYRLEILGALLSIQIIWLLTGIIVYEAIYRLSHSSEEVNGRLMFIVATIGLVVNIIMMFVLGHHGHGHSHSHDHGHGHSHSHDHGHSHKHGHSERHAHSHKHGDNDHTHARSTSHDHDHSHDAHEHAHTHTDEVDHHNHAHDLEGGHKGHESENISEDAIHHTPERKYSFNTIEKKDSVVVDADINERHTGRSAPAPGDLNVRGAWLHVIGDLIQSIGVMIGGAIIWVKPEWQIVDLICTLLFSVLVLWTTVNLLKEVIGVLMESTPREIDAKKLENGVCDIEGVIAVHELHIWAITTGKTLLACHVTIQEDADADDVLQKVVGYCDQVFNINHVTIQIERQSRCVSIQGF